MLPQDALSLRSIGVAALVFAILTIAVTYPVILQLPTHLAQNPAWSHDGFHHTYVLWWFKRSLLELHTSPADLRLINFPYGGRYPLLLSYSTVYAPGLPLLLFLRPPAVYNVLFLLTFFLSGMSGYALCAYLTGNRYAGLLGGIIYAFAPGRMSHALAGHLELISTYPFPLYVLLFILTARRPRWPTALGCGLTLTASLLVQPTYIFFLLTPITLLWMLCERKMERRAFWMLLCACCGGALLALPFFLPALREHLHGEGDYLSAGGFVRFSADLLGLIAPSPLNPFLRAAGIAPGFIPTDWRIAEVLTYVGLIPLTLALIAVWQYRRAVGAWGILAIGAAILSLGPLLKVGGRLVTFSVDDVTSPVALPYALFLKTPLLSYNRAPARIYTTLMLALSVLAAYGLSWALGRARGKWRAALAVVPSLLTLGEMLVAWPLPTTPLRAARDLPPLPTTSDRPAVLNLPLTAWTVKEFALFYQTLHGLPMFDSWVQRSILAPDDASLFLDGLLRPAPARDIIPTTSPAARAAVARAEGVGYVFLFTPYTADPEAHAQWLAETFGAPYSVHPEATIYRVPPGPTAVGEIAYALPQKDWWPVEMWEGQPARWMSESAEIDLYSPEGQRGVLRFRAMPASAPQRLQVEVNGAPLPPLVIGEYITYTTSGFTLRRGLNRVLLRALDGCTPSVIDPRCAGPARAAGAACDPLVRWDRCLGILLQDVRFTQATGGPAEHPFDVTLGGAIRFLGYDMRGDAAPGETLSLTLYWQAMDGIGRDYVIFVHLLGTEGAPTQHDAPPLGGLYPTSRWRAGDVITHRAALSIPPDAPPGKYELLAGMYSYPDLTRLEVVGEPTYAPERLIRLGYVEIR